MIFLVFILKYYPRVIIDNIFIFPFMDNADKRFNETEGILKPNSSINDLESFLLSLAIIETIQQIQRKAVFDKIWKFIETARQREERRKTFEDSYNAIERIYNKQNLSFLYERPSIKPTTYEQVQQRIKSDRQRIQSEKWEYQEYQQREQERKKAQNGQSDYEQARQRIEADRQRMKNDNYFDTIRQGIQKEMERIKKETLCKF